MNYAKLDSDHDMKCLVLKPPSPSECDGVKLRSPVPQVSWLQDVATLSIGQKSALVHIHLEALSLEVQGN